MFIHTFLFYVGTLLAVLLRKAGYNWDKRSFKTKWDVGICVPNLIMCVPMGIMGTKAAYTYWTNDDPVAQWGYTHDMRVIEVGTWFATYLITDLILGPFHKTMDKSMLVHHIIFIAMCLTHFWPPVGPGYNGSVMMAQEISTPFLDVFLLCRGFLGDRSMATQVTFVIFFLFFFVFRVIFNTVVTFYYFQELHKEFTTGESAFAKSRPWLIFISFLVLGGCAMQLHFFKVLALKVYKIATGKKKTEGKQKKAH